MKKKSITGEKAVTVGNSLLLFSVFTTIFVIPVFPLHFHNFFYQITYVIIFITSVLSLESYRRSLLIVAIVNIIAIILAVLFDMTSIETAAELLHVIFFFYVVFLLIGQITRKKQVDSRIILESINVYLLLGLLFSVLLREIYLIDSASFTSSQPHMDPVNGTLPVHNFIYFTLVTMTTLGYGDIVPVKPLTKSLTTVIAVVGQFYIAIIVAMLVGKYVSKN